MVLMEVFILQLIGMWSLLGLSFCGAIFDSWDLRCLPCCGSETGATCAVKEVEMIPDDPKCAESVKQLEQVIF